MNFFEDTIKSDSNIIKKYKNNQIFINDKYYDKPILLNANKIISWDVDINNLTNISCQQILDLKPSIILIGTGEKHIFISPDKLQLFYFNQIGIEIMSTEALSRTFNVLVSEQRNVVAGIIP